VEFIGLDTHRHYTVAARVDESGAVVEQRRLKNEDLACYLASLPGPARVALEATANWYHIYELVESLVAEVALGHPLKTRIIAEAKIKTDKVDATILAQLLRADMLPRAYIAPAVVRELRELLRLRASLVRQRTMVRNKVHAILIKRGLKPPVGSLFGKRGRGWLGEEAARLPQAYGDAIACYLRVLDALQEEIKGVSAGVEERAQLSEEACWLDTMPGIGPYTALLILAEVGDIKRFPDAAHLASYAGLVPSVHSSGGRTRYGSLTKQGSPWLRWAMVEAAHSAIRVRGPLRERYERMRRRKPHGTAIVDLARFMLGCIYAMLTERRSFKSVPRGSSEDMA
jgi:transposase